MRYHKVYVKNDIYPFIADGSKTREIRLNTKKNRRYTVGRTIRILSGEHRGGVLVKIVDRVIYKGVNELLENEDSDQIYPGISPVLLRQKILEFFNQRDIEKTEFLVFYLELCNDVV